MPLVSFRDVQKSYRSLQGAEYLAVDHFNVDIEAGEFFCLLGPSGCGKTTVLKMLAGFEAPTAGQIVMEGRPVTARAATAGWCSKATTRSTAGSPPSRTSSSGCAWGRVQG